MGHSINKAVEAVKAVRGIGLRDCNTLAIKKLYHFKLSQADDQP